MSTKRIPLKTLSTNQPIKRKNSAKTPQPRKKTHKSKDITETPIPLPATNVRLPISQVSFSTPAATTLSQSKSTTKSKSKSKNNATSKDDIPTDDEHHEEERYSSADEFVEDHDEKLISSCGYKYSAFKKFGPAPKFEARTRFLLYFDSRKRFLLYFDSRTVCANSLILSSSLPVTV